ncbi:homogentisate 1,2-dioxygenase [Nocardia fusca]|uniref:Homogentisate 1,2-dioxygenase n=1 Tax=Nocardia fusca TaxID=941183 RepID=A0ABV3FE91_9NOCA
MAYYRQLGNVPPKRHTRHRDDSGRLYYEELMGEEGFSSDSSLLYHRGIPSAISGADVWEVPDQTTTPNHPLTPRHLTLHTLFPAGTWAETDVVTGRRLLLGNSDVRISYVVAAKESPLYRNALGDEIVYLESGAARVETVFGALAARRGDYVVIPASTTHRWIPQGDEPLRAYAIESSSHIVPPKRYLSRFGQLLENAPYCERDLHGPRDVLLAEGDEVEVLVKHRTSRGIVGTRMVYPRHPFDVVGWDGCLYPYTFSIDDFEPITGRVHQPPPVHQVFEGTGFVVCNFVPRKVDYHPLAVPVPYYHSNVDSDEVMFYCGGNYEARKGSGIALGSVSVHPGGHAHGPQPGGMERSLGLESVEETAVMVDTFAPLELGEGALACEDPEYAWSWLGEASA